MENGESAPQFEILPELVELTPEGREFRFKGYTPQNFFNEKVNAIKSRLDLFGAKKTVDESKGEDVRDFGMQLEQLAQTLSEGHGLSVDKEVVGTMKQALAKEPATEDEIDDVRKKMSANLKTPNDYVIINFARGSIPQKSCLKEVRS